MIIPVRCFCCNKVIGHLWKIYKAAIDSGTSANDALNSINLARYCCRRMFLGHVDVIDNTLLYANNPGEQPMPKYIPPENEILEYAYTNPPVGESGAGEAEDDGDDYVDQNELVADAVYIDNIDNIDDNDFIQVEDD